MNNNQLILEMQKKLISNGENPNIANWIFCEVNNFQDLKEITKVAYDEVINEEIYWSYLNRYLDGEPLSRIFKKIHFFYHDFVVDDGIFCPRLETEILVEKVFLYCKDKIKLNILDLCSGTGVIGISLKLLLPSAKVTCSDINALATTNIKKNADLLKAKINIIHSDLFENINNQKFNVIVCNPPYISKEENLESSVTKYDPLNALFANDNGLEIYKLILNNLKPYLDSNDYLVAFEIGYNQGEIIKQLLTNYDNSCNVEIFKDYNNLDRVVIARKNF